MNHRARPMPADWPHRSYVAPQGRVEQGWPARRCSPEMAVYDSAADDERSDVKREELSPAEAYLLIVIYLLSCCIAAWVICLVVDWLRVAGR